MTTAATLAVVGIGEVIVSDDPHDTIVTYALGSCLGVVIYDPVARVGGMLHAMLPESSLSPEKAAVQPGRFVDTGVPHLFRACYRLGASKERLIVKVAGGAALRRDDEDDQVRPGRGGGPARGHEGCDHEQHRPHRDRQAARAGRAGAPGPPRRPAARGPSRDGPAVRRGVHRAPPPSGSTTATRSRVAVSTWGRTTAVRPSCPRSGSTSTTTPSGTPAT